MLIHLKKNDMIFLCITVILFFVLGFYMLFAEDYSLLIALACIVFGWGIWYSFNSFYENIFFFCFLLCFFAFLLGGEVINKFLHVYSYNFSDAIETHADFVIFLSLISLLLSYVITDHSIHKKRKPNEKSYETSYYVNVRNISRVIFFATYVFWVLTLVDIIFYVAQHGYLAYYISYSSRIPSYIRLVGYMSPVALFIFLATMPTKKEAKWPLLLYAFYSLLSLGTGRRINFMVGLLFIFAYMMLRNAVRPGDKPWISKRVILGICLLVPILLGAMYLFEYIRSDYYVGSSDQYSAVFGFFVRQGTSVNVIKYAELFKSRLDPDAHYALYNTIRWLQNSFLNDLFSLNLSFDFGGQTAQTATNGTYLADFVSYYANQSSYLSGTGYGSCYIEELYIDFGYLGVVLGNILYGFLLCRLFKSATTSNNIWLTAIGFFMVDELFKAPRATFDAFFGSFLYIQNVGTIVAVFIIVTIFYNRSTGANKIQLTA